MIQTENYPWAPINLIVFYKPILTAIFYKLPPQKKRASFSEYQIYVMDREAWRAAIHGVAKSQTRLSDWTELNWIYARETQIIWLGFHKNQDDISISLSVCSWVH